MKVAVVGSGIAGLTASWVLSREHDVTLFERHQRLGMDAHSIDINHDGVQARIDVPLRVFYEGYYPTLLSIYRRLGIAIEPIDYSASFSMFGEETYFRYRSFKLKDLRVPFVNWLRLAQPTSLRIIRDLIRYYLEVPRSLKRGQLNGLTINEYLRNNNYSEEFAQGFLFPAFAGICTCTIEAVRNYPASIIAEYLTRGVLLSGVRRVMLGAREVVEQLSRNIETIRCGTSIQSIKQAGNQVAIRDEDGYTDHFDHVVVATQANQALRLLGAPTSDEEKTLSTFRYEPSSIVLHRDENLLPPNRESWSPVNFIRSPNESAPMASIWMNAVQSDLRSTRPIFQSWNPIMEPREDLTLGTARFERPLVDAYTEEGVRGIERLHNEPNRRIWFCGSYAGYGIPLLESAASSAVRAARCIGVEAPI